MRLIKLLNRLPLAIPLLPLLYALQVCRREFGAVRAGEVAVFVLVYLLPAAVLCALAAIRRKESTAFIAALTMALLLYWETWARQPWLVAHVPLFTVNLVPVALAGLLVLTLRRLFARLGNDAQRRVLMVLNGTVVISVLTEAALLAAMHRPPEPAFAAQEAYGDWFPAGRVPGPRPNVYLIVFDEYASTAALREDWGFDNSAMGSFLRAQGFSVQDSSHANYPETYPSMASFLNLDYLPATKGNIVRMPEYHDYSRWIEQSALVRVFTRSGYRFINNSIFRMSGQDTRNTDPFYASGAKLLNTHTFAAYLVREYWPAVTHGTARTGYLAAVDSTLLAHLRYNGQAIAALNGHTVQGGIPTLVYTHILQPHNPYYYDSTGRLMDMDGVRAATMGNDPQAYLNNLRQANRVIREIIPRILQKEQGRAIIVLMGDHGYRNTGKPRRADAHFRNLSAVYFPDPTGEALPSSLTNVNLARELCRRALGATTTRLPDSIVHITERP